MQLPSGMWLWFCLSSVTQAGPASRCPWHQPRMGDICYKFVRLRNSFWGAQAWCQANGGRLACPWNPETQALRSHCMVEGEKWWVSLREHPGFSAHGADAAVIPSPAGCSYLIRDSGTIRSRRATCAQELYFICQFDWGERERNLTGGHQAGHGDRHRHQTHRVDQHRHQTSHEDRHRHQTGRRDRHRHETGRRDRHRHQTHRADQHRHQTSHGDRHRHQTGRGDRHRHQTGRGDRHRQQTYRRDQHRHQTCCGDWHRHPTSCGDQHRHQAGRWAPRAAQRRSHGLAGE
ncbi:hypothetical protein KIL84_005000 [Mauremys mutica]|uniref:C-type lectin domain-containing protein n=1 Tax=Mauremys mutica TaxID=74926 RepID=A0A9D4B5N4_9SAUR|nr:hypothetical protein KIL84_005000 [Mauremys mutica]